MLNPLISLKGWTALVASLALWGCGQIPKNGIAQSPSPAPSVAANVNAVGAHSAIRSVDFANFTYKARDGSKPITLFSGKEQPEAKGPAEIRSYLRSVFYGDVNSDEDEDAIVTLGIVTGGSAILHSIYIYTLERERPKLLWHFVSGDRAQGGLRNVFVDGGRVVVELYGKDRSVGGNLYETDDGVGDCCPKVFTRTEYEWRNNQFQPVGKPEVVTNPDSGAPLLMPAYKPN